MGITDRSSSRNGQRVIWLAVHTSEGGGTARDLRDATWWVGSSHAICDLNELLTPAEGCVPYDRASWTLRNGNSKSENIEQIGYAKWTRDYWLTERMPQLRHTARWIADRAAARGIPLEYIGIAGVKANRAGVIQHNDYSQGTGDGTHWDCGPGYPIDVVMQMARDGAPAPRQRSKGDEMLILFGKGAGPHGCSHAGILSGPLFVVVNNVAAFRSEGEAATKDKGLTSLWVSQEDWDQLVVQSAQARGVAV